VSRPLLLVTNLVPPDRVGALQALNEREGLEVAIYDGRLHHATGGVDDPGVPFRRVGQREVFSLAASGRYRTVIATSAGRVALPAAYFGARRARVPFIYWTGIWHQVATPAHLAAAPLVRWIESHADAVVAYGPHVADYVQSHGARNVHVAPQAVDVEFWGEPVDGSVARDRLGSPEFLLVFAGRDRPGKGLTTALEAWRLAGVDGALALAGVDASGPAATGRPSASEGVSRVEPVGMIGPEALRELFAAADALVIPSEPTASFREPWGLVANEAMLQGTPVIATDAVGAAAGGLVRDRETGIVVPAGDARALASAISRLAASPELRAGLAQRGRTEALTYDFEAWAQAFSRALESAGASKASC
jgi:glycosyltransferase involved in cell wall biosynthesis